jgi:hypothetical protein
MATVFGQLKIGIFDSSFADEEHSLVVDCFVDEVFALIGLFLGEFAVLAHDGRPVGDGVVFEIA